jgi:hypothetical protein
MMNTIPYGRSIGAPSAEQIGVATRTKCIVRSRSGFAVLILMTTAWWSPPAQGQTNNNQALADCVQAANQKYKDTWEALCIKTGKQGHCIDFIGSPRDKEFSQLRVDEMTLCSKLYGK